VGVAADGSDGDDRRENKAMACFLARRGGERRLNPTSPLDIDITRARPAAGRRTTTRLTAPACGVWAVSPARRLPQLLGAAGEGFLTNHAHVLERIADEPTMRLRDIAVAVGITERAAAAIANDLVEAGYLTKTRVGRRNKYDVHDELLLRHPLHRHHTVGELIRFLEGPATESRRTG
jgi:hypothetical protein